MFSLLETSHRLSYYLVIICMIIFHKRSVSPVPMLVLYYGLSMYDHISSLLLPH